MDDTTHSRAAAASRVKYEAVDEGYLEKRQLRRAAGVFHLWALGVGAVISGMFGGWNLGLAAGGFGGLAAATVLVTVMYVCMVYSIAELSAALPHAGGFYSFVRHAFGPWGGMVVGISDTIEYVLSPAAVVFFIGGYMNTLAPEVPLWVWWVSFYAIFIAINIRGVGIAFRVGLVITMAAIMVLAVFFVAAVTTGSFDAALLKVVPPEGGSPVWFPSGFGGIFAAIPFAIWFYLAIEQLPLSAEETHDVVATMPRALVSGIATLVVLAAGTLILNSGVGGGVAAMGVSPAPLADGFKAVFGQGVAATALTLVALTGLVASFHATLYAAGRVIFALSRAGYYPRWMSVCGTRTRTPHRALAVAGVVGVAVALACSVAPGTVGAALLNMAVFGAVISYGMVMLAYIRLKITRPELPRPYRSPLGIPGAVAGVAMAAAALAATLAVPDYRPAVLGTALFFVGALLYFAFYSSRRLVAEAPEEASALAE